MQTEIPVTSGKSNLKGKYNYSNMAVFCFSLLELVLCLTFSGKTANINVKNCRFIKTFKAYN